MKSLVPKLCAMAALGLVLCSGRVFGATNLISGEVTNHATWAGTNLVQGTVVVRSNVVVTISPGTLMLMNTNAVILVNGQLLAEGTASQPIWFTRATTAARWKHMVFTNAGPSRLQNCVIEYANSVGDHKDYYPSTRGTCNPPIFNPRTNYHEAVVALACHLDLEGCIFQNLPNAGGEGDAIAIISDHPDPTNTNLWNSASATVRNCQFLSVGQGVHTRYAYVLVENCYFVNKHGDNDDVDLWGESSPPPMIRNNLFQWPSYDDRIHPTRCSAWIIGNTIYGSTDHGIVLRDVSTPVVMNNVLYSCSAGGIAVQNGCDALLINNTLVNCNNAIKMFDHQSSDRIGPPYCLTMASGRATVINCLIWNSTPAFGLSGAAYGTLDTYVSYSDIQGGTNNASLGTKGRLYGGPGNINSDPLFGSTATTNFHLSAASPCIDAGTNLIVALTNRIVAVTNDYDDVPRPLDGNGDGLARSDMGAYEYLLATADSNGDGIPDGWTWRYGLNPAASDIATNNPDGDPFTTFQEWIADTDPTNAQSSLRIVSILDDPSVTVTFPSSTNRLYSLYQTTSFTADGTPTPAWSLVPGQTDVSGNGGMHSLIDTNAPTSQKFYRVGVRVP